MGAQRGEAPEPALSEAEGVVLPRKDGGIPQIYFPPARPCV